MLSNFEITKRSSKKPCVVWFPGLYSDLNGEKFNILKGYCETNNLSFVCFNYPHHGENESFQQFTLSEAVNDIFSLLKSIKLNYVFVGSSFGCWVSFLVAQKFIRAGLGNDIKGLLAGSPWIDDVRTRPWWQLALVKLIGYHKYKVGDNVQYIYWHFVKDALLKHNNVWDTGLIEKLNCPIRAIHGSNDDVADVWISKKFNIAKDAKVQILPIGHEFDGKFVSAFLKYLDELCL